MRRTSYLSLCENASHVRPIGVVNFHANVIYFVTFVTTMRKVIRVSEDVHRELKASAARRGKTLSAYADELLRRALATEVVKSE
ncbi:hypothetical protein B9Q13_01100 [Candidatus Marsarchaeota G2 archaeon ECH_B_SAG-G16]|uniref:Ribbon-helix-helix protein CopG domain-containing protein n=1 Tax=Candidatus Marsarchaeota G2 archaeon ECH_B_SAG-G16 TaxID=1978167 RepID=A0A2R6C4Q9_9ARCH|nr:MAG: hypothetical protein B9Q13_01100 [Candidatus Marsarchaeota G2 archaeon ECH_B_SAG-G16]